MLDSLFLKASELIGAPPDHIKLIFCLLSAYPLSSLFHKLPTDGTRHYYTLFVSSFYLLGILKLYAGFVQLVLSCCLVYLVVIFDRSNRMPWTVFCIAMGHLTINHIYRAFHEISGDIIEITGAQMVLVMKLTTFAWNVYDGRQPVEKLDSVQLTTRLTKVPGIHAFLGYCLFFPSLLVGPSFEFSIYSQLCSGALLSATPSAPTVKGKEKEGTPAALPKVPKGRKRVAYTHMLIGLFFLGFYSFFGAKATYETTLLDRFMRYSVWYRLLFIQACGVVARTKYYAIWELTEGAIILCGVGFNGYDPKTGRTRWNRCRNIDVLRIETAENYKVLFDNWNMRTSVWLRETVYKRVTPPGKKPGPASSMITFITSAFWHGTYPGYYIAFVHAGILTSLGRLFRKNVRPLLLPPDGIPPTHLLPHSLPDLYKRIYDIGGWLFVQLTLNYLASSFLLLSFAHCIKFFNRAWWYGDIAIVASFAFFSFGGRAMLKRLQAERKGKDAVAQAKKDDGDVPAAAGGTPAIKPSPVEVTVTAPPTSQAQKAGDADWEGEWDLLDSHEPPRGFNPGSIRYEHLAGMKTPAVEKDAQYD